MATRRREEPKESKYGTLIVVILIPLITFIGGTVTMGYTFYDRIATKPYVDDKVGSSLKYTDEKTMQILKEAYEHSDTNRREMMMSTEKVVSELKIRNAIVDTKLELLLKSMSEIKDWTNSFEANQHRPRR